MKRLPVLIAASVLAMTTPVFAQLVQPPLGITSPLGIGPGAQVGATGIPMGATELATPGIAPPLPTTTLFGPVTGSNAACGGSASLTTGISDPTALFDAGMSAGTASGTCATSGGMPSRPTASASSPTGIGAAAVGRIGIPMGSVELDPGGLSPPPAVGSPMIALPTTPQTLTGIGTPSMNATIPSVAFPMTSAPTPQVPPGTPCPSTGMLPPSGMC